MFLLTENSVLIYVQGFEHKLAWLVKSNKMNRG
jgi:hypothetical protein